MNDALKPYLARSFGLHLAAVAAYLFLIPKSGTTAAKTYMIDFVGGGSVTLQSAGATKASAASAAVSRPAEVAAQADPDAITTKGKRHAPFALPRPSLLHGAGKETEVKASPTATLAGPGGTTTSPAATDGSSKGPGGEAGAGAGVATDLPNFPYPWYISQVRLMLWTEWQKRMPRADAEGAVGFSILRNGSYTDLSIESSSGDSNFDQAALAAVQAAAPFPALPADFREPFLKIHLSLKSEEAWR